MRTLAEVLDELACHEFDLPRFLAEQGVKGSRENYYKCPVAVYLLRETGASAVEVFCTFSTVTYEDEDGCELYFTEQENPPAVREFVASFDEGCYPELDSNAVSMRMPA